MTAYLIQVSIDMWFSDFSLVDSTGLPLIDMDRRSHGQIAPVDL